MKVTILTDNRANKRGIWAEHGLSLFIEYRGLKVLFDTGQSEVFRHNAFSLGVPLQETDYIVISHGHYDHGGGLPFFPSKETGPPIYLQKNALQRRYKKMPGEGNYQEVGIPWLSADEPHLKEKLVFIEGNTELVPGVMLCSKIPQSVDFETVTPGFYLEDQKTPDLLVDEQMLVFDTKEGLCLFLGCSHPGVANCLNYALKLFPGRKIKLLVAGLHLSGAGLPRVEKTIQYLQGLAISQVVPLHCTGIRAIIEIERALGERCSPFCAGDLWSVF